MKIIVQDRSASGRTAAKSTEKAASRISRGLTVERAESTEQSG